MLKLAGAATVCISAAVFGICLAGELKEKVRLLEEFRRCFFMIRGEIRFSNATLSEAFMSIENRGAEPLPRFFGEMGKLLEENPERGLGTIWREQTAEIFGKSVFSGEELQWISGLGERLGYLDRETQLGTLEMILEQLEAKEAEADRIYADKGKVYRCVGAMSGILVVLLLL